MIVMELSLQGQQVFNVLRHFNFANNNEIQRYVEQNILGLYAQTEWDWQRLVYLTLAARKDWVSNLAKENASIIYPSASVSFIPTKLWDRLKNENINYIKVRAGYGTSANFPGAQSIDELQSYPIASILSFDTQYFQNSSGNNVISNTSGSQLGNSNLKPERVDEIELGIEGSFIDNRIGLDFSLYQRNTIDLIVEQPLDPSTGYIQTQTNIGKIENKGIEIDINADILREVKSFDWNIGINYSSNESIVADLGDQDIDRVPFAGFTNGQGNAAAVGESLGSIWGTSIARDDVGRFLVNNAGSYVEDTSLSIIGETYLRYNGFTDEIEIGKNANQKVSDEIILKNNKIICSFGGRTYIYLPFKNKNNKIELGYLTSIYKGNKNHLYERKRKIYREAKIARTSLERTFPPRLIDEKSFYFSIENETPYYLGKDIKKILKNLPPELIKAAKEKSIRIKGITNIKSLQHFFTQIE